MLSSASVPTEDEEWRDLAKTVPGDLFTVGFELEGLLVTVAATRSRLDALVPALKEIRADVAPRGDIGDNLATLPGWPFQSLPSEDLDRAIDKLKDLYRHHGAAYLVFLLYGRVVRLEDRAHAAWLDWHRRHADAFRHAKAALRRLRTAASLTRAAEDAVRSAQACPPASLRWDAWMKSAIQLGTYAGISATMAIYALCCMCVAVALEFHDASAVVNR